MTQSPIQAGALPQRLAIEDMELVAAPIEEVYQRWSDFSHFPDFMRNVISVTSSGGKRHHWVVSFFGQRQEWDTEETAREALRIVAWQSVTGLVSSGQLTFTPRDERSTEVRLYMELTPPEDLAPQRFDKLAQTARKRAHSDMRRFSRRIAPRRRRAAPVACEMGLAAQLGASAIAAGVSGYVAYVARRRMRRNVAYRALRSQVTPSAARISGMFAGMFAGMSVASIIGAMACRQLGKMGTALFVGQWAPTLIASSGFVRALGHRGIQTSETAAIVSWSLVGGGIGSSVASGALRVMGRRKQSLFVGQWAPVLMGAATLSRLIERR